MKKILVTGANGQLGQEFQQLAPRFDSSYQFYFFSKSELDISNREEVQKKIEDIQPDFFVNCAAYTAVDKAETEQDHALAINAFAVENMALACKRAGARFIHVSTDYVFDGNGTRPYKEDDAVDPVNAYGASKLKGEELAVQANEQTIIIRTSWVYSAFGNNFVKTMLRLMQSRPEVNVVDDQQGSPTYAADLAEGIMEIIDSGKWVPGIYHFSNEGVITWYDFASEIKKLSGYAAKVNAIPTEQYPTPARRPHYSVFDKTKIQETFGIRLKNWQEGLQQCMDKMKQLSV